MRALYFCPVVSSFFLFSSSNLSHRRLDVCHTSTYGVAVVRIYDAGLKRAAQGSLKTRDAKIAKNSPSGAIPQLCRAIDCILATKARIDNLKKLLSSNISSTCPNNMVNFGPLAAAIGPIVWGTPANFHGFRVLAALPHGTLVVGVSQTLRR